MQHRKPPAFCPVCTVKDNIADMGLEEGFTVEQVLDLLARVAVELISGHLMKTTSVPEEAKPGVAQRLKDRFVQLVDNNIEEIRNEDDGLPEPTVGGVGHA